MQAFEKVLSGIPDMDTALDYIRLGDNVVWEVSDLSEFKLFVEPYIKQAIEDKRNIIYFRFASHDPVIDDHPEVKKYTIPLSHRFENFTVEIHNIIEKEGRGAFYVFDCLSELQTAWATDMMMGNFFRVTCPFLFILDTVAFFPVIRGKHSVYAIDKIRDIDTITSYFGDSEYIDKAYLSDIDPATGEVTINLSAPSGLYSQVLKDIINVDISSKADLLNLFQEFNEAKNEYDQIKGALKTVKQTGYGIASPTLADMKLETPEIIKQGSRYGVKLKAKAPSIHMIKVDVESTFEPIIGSEMQSKELINSLTDSKNSNDIWKSEIFGRSLDVIVQEGIQAKLAMMPDTVRYKLCQTLTKIINKGSSTMIAIVL